MSSILALSSGAIGRGDEGGEAGVPPGGELGDQDFGDGPSLYEASQQVLTEQFHQPLVVPLLDRMECAVFRVGAVGGQYVTVWMPLGQVPGRRHTDNNTGRHPGTKRLLHEGTDGRCRCMSKLAQQLAPAAEERTQQPRNREHDMPVRNRLQQLSPHPLRPQERSLLLTGRAEASGATGKRHRIGDPARVAEHTREAVSWDAAPDEPPQDALDGGPQRAVFLGEALVVHAEELVDVLADKTEQR
jgi:hypothetical protein